MHEKILHGGVATTLAKIREKYWLLKGRQTVKKCLRRCVWCKRINGLPYRNTPIADLPEFRVDQLRAFNTVGVDYCGPLRYGKGEGQDSAKAYICLFTCASTRALHLELVTNMSTDGFLRALRRFIARRGIPAIVSDNFASFKRAFSMIDAVRTDSNIQRFAAENRITWYFTVEHAPWYGGFFERLVKEVKDTLKKTLKFNLVTFEELRTLVTEVESVLNSRPLCYVSDEVEQVLTPSHFLILKRHGKESKRSIPEINILAKYKGSRRMIERFWDTWYKQYLTALRERMVAKRNKCSKTTPKRGDIVLLKDSKPRLQWKLGTVETLHMGRDGTARSASVRILRNGAGPPKLLRRPVNLLVPLELTTACV